MAQPTQDAGKTVIVPELTLGRLDHIGDLDCSGDTVLRTLRRKRIVGYGELNGCRVVVKIANPSIPGSSEALSVETLAREKCGDTPGLIALRASGTVNLDRGPSRSTLQLPYLAEARAPHDLSELLQKPSFTGRRLIAIWVDVARACACLHRHGYSHGDIKPDNVLCGPDGEDVALCDFGSMKRIEFDDAPPVGSPGYFSAPELLQSAQSDVFSLGVLLHTLLSDTQFPMWRWGGLLRQREQPNLTCLEWTSTVGPLCAPLIRSMTQIDSGERPTLDNVIEAVRRLAQ